MSNTAALMGMNLGEARRREARAKERRERNQVSPEVRAARAAIIEAREAVLAEQQATAKAEQQARPDAVRTVLAHASLDELAELQRVAGQLDGRRLADIVGDVLRQRQRGRISGGTTTPSEASQSPAKPRQRAKVI